MPASTKERLRAAIVAGTIGTQAAWASPWTIVLVGATAALIAGGVARLPQNEVPPPPREARNPTPRQVPGEECESVPANVPAATQQSSAADPRPPRVPPRPVERPARQREPVVRQPAPTIPERLEPSEPPANNPEDELSILTQAFEATRASRWDEAADFLEGHRRRFPQGALRIEADALRAMVWCGQGRVDEAQQLARELERSAWLNPAVQRLRQTCANRLWQRAP